jgi:hypothetical protein
MPAQKTGGVFASSGAIARIHTATEGAQNAVGTVVPGLDALGFYAEYIYLKGVASTLAGSWVTYDELGLTTLTAANALGPVAIAQAAILLGQFGWYAIWGAHQGLCLASYADNAKVWCTSTAGSVDDADVAVDLITGAVGRSARDTTTGMALFQIQHPWCHNEVLN